MLMGHSVEGRFPFLDYRVAEFAAALPDDMKLRGLREKYLLRKVAAALLPAEIAGRTKRPYRAPIVSAFVGPQAPEYVHDALAPDRLGEVGVFQPEAIERLLRKCETAGEAGVGETDEMALVGAISVMLLHERFIARPTLAQAAEATKMVVGDSVEAPATAAA
jgi:asparagine synthase (glutamine-hydrolysing)